MSDDQRTRQHQNNRYEAGSRGGRGGGRGGSRGGHGRSRGGFAQQAERKPRTDQKVALSLDRMIAKGGDPRYLKELKEKQYIARAKKYKSFHGMKKHLEGESSLVYVNKVEKNEEFVSDLRDRDQELMADKKEREARKRAARLDENAKINAALQGITRLRKLKKRRRHHSHKDDEAEDNGSDSEQGDEFLASLSEDARAGLALLKSQGRVIDKDGKIRKQTLVEVAKEARVKKHLEAVERAREREEHQQKIQSNIDKRRKLSMKHRMRTPKGQPLLKNMVFDMVRKLKSDRKQ